MTIPPGNECTVHCGAPTDDHRTLTAVVEAVRGAGVRLLELYTPDARPANRVELLAAISRNEASSLEVLRPAISAVRPDAGWVDEDKERTLLDPGEWWAVDAVEGNVNHIHGLPEWCVTATLVRDNAPVLTVVHEPLGDLTYTAVRNGGAHLNGSPLRVSNKTELATAITATGQAEVGQTETYRRIGESTTAMLGRALLVRMTVPATIPLLMLSGGHVDVFWQYKPVLTGIAAGALLVVEAGGLISDLQGREWGPESSGFLAAAPGVRSAAVEVLAALN